MANGTETKKTTIKDLPWKLLRRGSGNVFFETNIGPVDGDPPVPWTDGKSIFVPEGLTPIPEKAPSNYYYYPQSLSRFAGQGPKHPKNPVLSERYKLNGAPIYRVDMFYPKTHSTWNLRDSYYFAVISHVVYRVDPDHEVFWSLLVIDALKDS